jgi:cell division protein FtsB
MRKIVLYGVIIFQILLIISLIRGIQISRKSSERIASLEQVKEKLLQESQKIKQEGEYVQSPFYLEKVARDELNLAKPGETVVIVPEGFNQELGTRNQELGSSGEKPNWQKWWEVLSGRI